MPLIAKKIRMEYLLGIAVALIVEAIKKFVKNDPFTTHLVLFVVSIAGAGLYVWASSQDFWPAVIGIAVVAAAFHNLVIRKFTDKE